MQGREFFMMADLSDKYEYDKCKVVPIDLKKIFNKPK